MTTPDGSAVSEPWRYVDSRLSDVLRAQVDQLVARVADGVTASVPAFSSAEGPKLSRDLREAVRVAVTRFLDLVGTDQEAVTPQVREVFRSLGAAEARENREPEVLLAALRISSRLLLRATVDALDDERTLATEDLLGLADAVAAFIDELAAASTDGFASQVRAAAGERDRLRTRLADMLAEGGASESELSAAAAAIGWTRPSRFVPVLLPIDEAREARFRLGDDGVVTERAGMVLALVREGARSDRESLSLRLHGRGAVVGPTVGWTELPTAIRLTELTNRRTAADGDPGDAFVWVDDHLATLAISGETRALELLERRWLAPLDVVSVNQADALTRTLHSWLRNWGSRSAVAQELFIHQQTVSYRIRRVGELLGGDLNDPTTRFELSLVLAKRFAA